MLLEDTWVERMSDICRENKEWPVLNSIRLGAPTVECNKFFSRAGTIINDATNQ